MIADGLTPIKRWGNWEDVGRAVAAIASGSLPFSTGEVINVDVVFISGVCEVMSENLLSQVEHAFSFAQEQVSALVKRDPDFYPLYTDHGKWRHTKPAWTRWCDGFLPGMMWIFHQETDDPNWRTLAEKYSRPLEPRKDDREVHDLGFIFYHGTYKRWYEATVRDGSPDQSLKDVVCSRRTDTRATL
jgi:hypothetical protein